MALEVGTTLGSYSVTAKIGEGGMGEVYRARDTKLDRDVALKVLPEAFTSDPDRLARFEREAKVLASLNHPNIGGIHGLEESDGVRALVLEYIEGPTLADRIAQGPIPIDEALPIAKQIAEALEAAHEAGVIHRDLKPANIKVRDDGTVKVLDFGLAKALDTTPESDPSLSPTLTAAATQMGVIMGTAAYMSPEQAKGKPIDRRADIWAFGAVLYEMLSGRKPFVGDDVSDTMALVLKFEPEWDALPADTPARLRQLIRTCLQKSPKQRVQAIGDVRLAMEGAFETTMAGTLERATARSAWWRRVMPWAAGMVVVGFVSGLGVWTVTRPEVPRVVHFTLAPDDGVPLNIGVSSQDIASSPNGEYIAYLTAPSLLRTGAEQLRLRPLGQRVSETIVTGGEFGGPFFSPDSQAIGFYDFRSGRPVLQRVGVRGGPVSTIVDDLPASLRGASWAADNTIIYATNNLGSGLWRVAAVGGEPSQLTTPDTENGEVNHQWPDILPGGEAVLFTIRATPIEDSRIAVLALDTLEQKVVLAGGTFPKYSPTGHLLYIVQGTLWAVGFDTNRLETVGAPVPVQEGVLTKLQGGANFSLSVDGSLSYISGTGDTRERTLVWVNREGDEEPLPTPPAPYDSPRISPNGQHVAVEVRNPENTDVMVYDLQQGTPVRLTFDPGVDESPLWSPDGRRVFFSSTRGGMRGIFSRAADGTGEVEQLTTSDARRLYSWSADGQTLVVGGDTGNLTLVSVGAERETEELIHRAIRDIYAAVSSDGRFVAYASNEPGGYRINVRPFPNVEDGQWQVPGAGVSPVWTSDGREMFFRFLGGPMMVVRVQTEPTFSLGNPEILFSTTAYRQPNQDRNRPWDLAPDGRFLMVKEAAASDSQDEPSIEVVLNWTEELKRLVPVD
jgi:serine/threonine-protein kinase